MQFDLTDEQAAVLDSLRTLLGRAAGPERMTHLGGDNPSYDTELHAALEASGFAGIGAEADAGPLDAALVVEEVARHLGVVALATRALVRVGLGINEIDRGDDSGPLAIVTAGHRGPTRYGADATHLIVVGPDHVALAPLERGAVPRLRARFGYPFGDLAAVPGGTVVEGADPSRAVAWWRVALATEMAGTMRAALDLTVQYVSDRKQFGRAIGSFQALQHRLAELTVNVDASRYLALAAADRGAPADAAATALTYASTVAKRLPGELHQMTGAMGFATEYPLHLWTMRLPALLAESRGLPSAEADLVALRWPGA